MKRTTTLPSGIEAVYTFMTNETVDLLTVVGGESAINQILERCIVSLGSTTNISIAHIEKLHYGDKRYLLFKIRQLTYDDNTIEFSVQYKGKKYDFIEEDLESCLKIHSLLTKNGDTYVVSELADLPKQYEVTVKDYPEVGSDIVVVLQYLTSSNLEDVSNQKVSDILRLRNPSIYGTIHGTDTTVLRPLNIGLFPAGKSKGLFKAIKDKEINVSTTVKYNIGEESFEKDLLQMPEFFFQGII